MHKYNEIIGILDANMMINFFKDIERYDMLISEISKQFSRIYLMTYTMYEIMNSLARYLLSTKKINHKKLSKKLYRIYRTINKIDGLETVSDKTLKPKTILNTIAQIASTNNISLGDILILSLYNHLVKDRPSKKVYIITEDKDFDNFASTWELNK